MDSVHYNSLSNYSKNAACIKIITVVHTERISRQKKDNGMVLLPAATWYSAVTTLRQLLANVFPLSLFQLCANHKDPWCPCSSITVSSPFPSHPSHTFLSSMQPFKLSIPSLVFKTQLSKSHINVRLRFNKTVGNKSDKTSSQNHETSKSVPPKLG